MRGAERLGHDCSRHFLTWIADAAPVDQLSNALTQPCRDVRPHASPLQEVLSLGVELRRVPLTNQLGEIVDGPQGLAQIMRGDIQQSFEIAVLRLISSSARLRSVISLRKTVNTVEPSSGTGCIAISAVNRSPFLRIIVCSNRLPSIEPNSPASV